MDLDGLLPLLLAAAYFILRALGSRKQQNQQREQALDPEAPRSREGQVHADPFEEALRQIREALGEPAEEEKPQKVRSTGQRVERPLERPAERRARQQQPADAVGIPETPPVPASRVPERQRSFSTELEKKTPDEPRPGTDEHLLEGEGPLAAERFEELGESFRPAGLPKKRRRNAKPSDPAPTSPSLRQRLHDAEKARDAFVMAEVLGPPRSRRPAGPPRRP